MSNTSKNNTSDGSSLAKQIEIIDNLTLDPSSSLTITKELQAAKAFQKERDVRISMASVLLFDAINDNSTRHRIESSFDRKA